MVDKVPNKREKGAFGEAVACKYLEQKGYIIKDKNFRAGRIGELDIVAQFEDNICFVEVKSRKTLNYGTPSEAVTYRKQQKIKLIAQIYMKSLVLKVDYNIRFDIIEIFIGGSADSPIIKSINHIENAF
jgi:putative endonuclease